TWLLAESSDESHNRYTSYGLLRLELLGQKQLSLLETVGGRCRHAIKLIFAEKEVLLRRTTAQGESTEQVPLSTHVQAEGPGLDVFVAELPLAVGYRTRYTIVDRWGGHGAARVKAVVLSVGKRATEQTSLGQLDIYELLIQTDDDSFQIKEKVLARSPHFPVRVEYTRNGKVYPPSEVIAMISQP
ncbi:MAG TPA: hypothetical protein VKW06_13080, partial [Candidatus Angelobacter sp.]|nr:hypothetical protein [Candidatus Angelobacter sp.]